MAQTLQQFPVEIPIWPVRRLLAVPSANASIIPLVITVFVKSFSIIGVYSAIDGWMEKKAPFDQRPYRKNMEFRQPFSFPSSAILEIRFFK
jgi:hypothetical protein